MTQLPDIHCHYCNHSLLDTGWLIHGLPSIRVTAAFGMEHGWFRLSARPDRCFFMSEHEFPSKGEADFFCPHCHTQLFSSENCPECKAPMIPVVSTDGDLVPVCSSPHDRCRKGACCEQYVDSQHNSKSKETGNTLDATYLVDATDGSIQ